MSHTPPDVYVIGFQEVVGLNAKSVWNADESNTNVWHAAILQAIQRLQPTRVLLYFRLVIAIHPHLSLRTEICQAALVSVGGPGVGGVCS